MKCSPFPARQWPEEGLILHTVLSKRLHFIISVVPNLTQVLTFIFQSFKMSLIIPANFQHILRVMNTNIDGKRNIMFAMTSIKGMGRRYANIVLKKADIDLTKRAGELSEEEIDKIVTIMQNPRQYKIPNWFLNRQRDIKDGKNNKSFK